MRRWRRGFNAALVLVAASGAALGAGCRGAPAGPDDVAEDEGEAEREEGRIRVATWNVWRLFDSTCDSGRCQEWEFEAVPTAAQVDARLDEVAAIIRGLRPDVALLQEIETEGLLGRLRARLSDVLPYSGFGETGGEASVDVGVLSAHRIVETLGHSDEPLRREDGERTWFSRELLEARIDVDGRQLAAFTAHFRSKVDDDPERRRLEAEATAEVLAAAAQSLPEALVVLGGDLNDTPGSPPLDALERIAGLQRVAAELADDADSTYVFRGRPLALDHIYVAPTPGARYVPGTARVVRETGASDHAAVYADFEFR